MKATMSSCPTKRYYLDCPFSENEEAKSLGALFDGPAKRWYVSPELYPILYQFNRWTPTPEGSSLRRHYLNCTYAEKDEAKQAGAKWDPVAKAWYVPAGDKSNLDKFSKWLPEGGSASDNVTSKTTPSSKGKAKSSRGNAQDAAVLRISDTMTVGQLQDECRLRGIKGLSGKNKDWLLEQLHLGSIWQTVSLKSAGTPTSSSASKAKVKATTKMDNDQQKKKPPATTKEKAPAKHKTPAKQPTKKVAAAATAAASKTASSTKGKVNTAQIECSTLPKVNSDLTVAQLMHELLHRQPQTKGTSNKSKTWFIEQLGEQSIWTSSPNLINQDLSHLPTVSSSLTIAQLTHELMSRAFSSKDSANLTKGISTKNKQDLLKLVGVGSIWTTGVVHTTSDTVKTAAKKKEAPSQSSAKKKAATATAPVAKANKKPKTSPTIQDKKKPPKPDPAPLSSVSNGASLPRPPSTAVSSNSEVRIAPSTFLPGGNQQENKTRKNIVLVKNDVKIKKEPGRKGSNKNKERPDTVTSSSDRIKREVAAPVMGGSSKESLPLPNKKKRAAPSNKNAEQKVAPAKKVKRAEPVIAQGGIPVVTSDMTVAQLKDELKARKPNLYSGSLSNLKKGWLLEELGLGTELIKAKQDADAAKLHIHKSQCHVHLLANSSVLRPHRNQFVLHASRANTGRCDIKHPNICQGKAYRTCESCDWDICQTCFEIEDLPTEKERKNELRRQQAAREAQIKAEQAQIIAKRDADAAKLHIHKSRCHDHLLANSSVLRAPNNYHGNHFVLYASREHTGICDIKHPHICQGRAYRTCERCDWDICQTCFEIESLPTEKERKDELRRQQNVIMDRNAEIKQQSDIRALQIEDDMFGSNGDDSVSRDFFGHYHGEEDGEDDSTSRKKFPAYIQKPSALNKNETKKLKYTVWRQESEEGEKEFDTSFDNLNDANFRVEYLFRCDFPPEDDDYYPIEDKELKGGLRYMSQKSEGRGSLTVSVLPSEVFDALLNATQHDVKCNNMFCFRDFTERNRNEPRKKSSFAKNIRDPKAVNTNVEKKLKFTVWTSSGYDNDRWHRCEGMPFKEFNSSYSTMEQANERAEYVFLYHNPWGYDEYELPCPDTDAINRNGFRRLECCPDDSQRWTVAVVPSIAFDYINL